MKRAANNALKLRNFNDQIEHRWDVWLVNGEKVVIKADRAHYKDGVLTLQKGPESVACIINFKAAEQFAHGGFDSYIVNDGTTNHYVEANMHSRHSKQIDPLSRRSPRRDFVMITGFLFDSGPDRLPDQPARQRPPHYRRPPVPPAL